MTRTVEESYASRIQPYCGIGRSPTPDITTINGHCCDSTSLICSPWLSNDYCIPQLAPYTADKCTVDGVLSSKESFYIVEFISDFTADGRTSQSLLDKSRKEVRAFHNKVLPP